jgi:hypothetical protein
VSSFRGKSKAVCPMSQIFGMLKNPTITVEVSIVGKIDRDISRPYLHLSLIEVSRFI